MPGRPGICIIFPEMTATQQNNANPAIPTGRRIYAIGDIHGRRDLLERLIALIVSDAATRPGNKNVLVFLGDYVDRGPDSRGVLDLLCGPMPDDFETVFLEGNHEYMMLRFLADHRAARVFLDNGGAATLVSYGCAPDKNTKLSHQCMLDAVDDKHIWFLNGLKLMHLEGDYLFVHAGVNPGIDIDKQEKADLLWIREKFLDWQGPLSQMVVHGHSVTSKPEQLSHRIGIDTGAWRSGRLTCLVLEGAERRFLST